MTWCTLETLTIEPPRPASSKCADRLLGAEEGAAQVDGEHLVEVGDRELVGVLGDLDAGVVDEDVDAAVLVEHLLEHRRRPGPPATRRRRRGSARVPAAAICFMQISTPCSIASLVSSAPSGAPDVVDRDVDALLAEPDGDGLPDARAASGDDGDLAGQTLHDCLLGVRLEAQSRRVRRRYSPEDRASGPEERQRFLRRRDLAPGPVGAERCVPERVRRDRVVRSDVDVRRGYRVVAGREAVVDAASSDPEVEVLRKDLRSTRLLPRHLGGERAQRLVPQREPARQRRGGSRVHRERGVRLVVRAWRVRGPGEAGLQPDGAGSVDKRGERRPADSTRPADHHVGPLERHDPAVRERGGRDTVRCREQGDLAGGPLPGRREQVLGGPVQGLPGDGETGRSRAWSS